MAEFIVRERAAGAGGVGYWARLVADHVQASLAVRRGQGDGAMRRMWGDLAAAARTLGRAPSFTLFAVLTLALGIGATTAVFSVLDRVVLRPLPYPGSERMALIGIEARHDPGGLGPLSGALMARLQETPGPAEQIVAAGATGAILLDGAEPERLSVTRITRGFLPFFGARPALGRLLEATDHDPGAARVAVLGHGFWRDRYGADPAIVGRTVRLNDDLVTVVGVLDEAFVPPPEITDARDIWVPLALVGDDAAPGHFYLAGAARLRPGTTLADLDAHADRVVSDQYAGDGPDFLVGGSVASYRHSVVGEAGGRIGRVLAAVGLLLLIACVNVASLLLTRGAQRAPELAVRVALGAGRRRLLGQLMAESGLIAVAAGAVGGAIAWAVVELFRRQAPPGLPRLEEVAVDGRGLGFAVLIAGSTVLLFGLLPALRSVRSSAPGAGVRSGRASAGRREGRVRGALVAVETALAVVLAVGSALLAHDLVRLAREDPGFRPDGLVTMRLDLAPRFEQDEWVGVWERLLDGARTLPGVTAAAVATQAPYAGTRVVSMYRPEGTEGTEGAGTAASSGADEGVFVVTVMVAGDYAATLGGTLVEGRGFLPADDGSTAVALVNEAFVRRYWPGEPAAGRRVRSGGAGVEDEPVYEVVGVLADVRTHAGREVPPHIFLPLRESPWRDMELMVRAEGDVTALAPALRALVRRVDPNLPISRIGTVQGLAHEGLARPRFYTVLFGGFAAVALLLAIVGVYGTTAYATRARVREIGIRMALGARRRQVVAATVLKTGAAVALGVVLGLAGAWGSARAMTDVLTYVTPRDGAAFTLVAFGVLAAGLLAAWVPAGRAGRVDPATTLREE
jgi:predicted permease